MIVLYCILLVFLLFLWFLFVYDFRMIILIENDSLVIRTFFIKIYEARNQKLFNLIYNSIPRNRKMLEKDIDYSRLIYLIHIDYLENIMEFVSYNSYILVTSLVNGNLDIIKYLLSNYVKKYNFHLRVNNKNMFRIKAKIRFNIGIIILNIIKIKLRYKNEENIK